MGQIDFWGNETEEEKPLTYEQKIEQAKDVLCFSADVSMKYYGEPLLVTYSGGKDSDVMLHIAEGCLKHDQFEVMNSHTTVDAPQTVRHIEKVFRDLNDRGIKTGYHNRYPVQKTMWELIVERRMPPTRLVRYCCAVLKETTTPNRMIAVGVRSDESTKRKNRGVFQISGGHAKKDRQQWSLNHAREVFQDAEKYDEVFDCQMVTAAKQNKDLICNPILTFTYGDVWRYIEENAIEVNPLYKCGYRRVGCIGCPLGGRKNMIREFADFPKHKQAYLRAFERMLEKRKEVGSKVGWKTAEEVFDWWVNGGHGINGQMKMNL